MRNNGNFSKVGGLKRLGAYLILTSLIVAAASSVSWSGPPAAKNPPRTIINPQNMPLPPVLLPSTVNGVPIFQLDNPFDDPITLDLTFDWTNCQVHRVFTTPDITIILPGSYVTNNAQIWRLNVLEPVPGSSPQQLYFIQDVYGTPNPSTSGVPLTYEIAFDGGTYSPMTLLPDNTLTAIFPAGAHTFQLRLIGTMQAFQSDGYYQVKLSEYFIPQL